MTETAIEMKKTKASWENIGYSALSLIMLMSGLFTLIGQNMGFLAFDDTKLITVLIVAFGTAAICEVRVVQVMIEERFP